MEKVHLQNQFKNQIFSLRIQVENAVVDCCNDPMNVMFEKDGHYYWLKKIYGKHYSLNEYATKADYECGVQSVRDISYKHGFERTVLLLAEDVHCFENSPFLDQLKKFELD